MTGKLRPTTTYSISFLKGVVFVSLLIGALSRFAAGQTAPRNIPSDLYAGIELCVEGARAIVLRYSRDEESPGAKLVYAEVARVALVRTSTGEFDPQTAKEAALAVTKLLTRLRQGYRVPDDRIYLIGSSGLGVNHPKDLLDVIKKATGRTLTFHDAATDVQLSISGTIPQHEKVDEAWIDARNSSALVEVGSSGTQAGFQLVRYLPPAPPKYEFVTMTIPYGTTSLTNEITRAQGYNKDLTSYVQRTKTQGAASFRQSLRKEFEGNPSLLTRKQVYLSGDIVWALVTLLLPEQRQSFVPLTSEKIAGFVDKVFRNPAGLLNQDVPRIRDRRLKQEAEKELDLVRNTFTPQQLVAGAELLKIVAAEFDLQEKKIWFARYGHLSRILSYVRLQAEK